MRAWSHWTRNKLMILEAYLPRFTTVSKKSRQRPVYLDLMAGEAENVARETGEPFDGSARVAMACQPPFGRIVLFEKSKVKAAALEADIAARYPGDDRVQVVAGDCNSEIHRVLAALQHERLRLAPTFAFLDQQVAQIHWTTLQALARHKGPRAKTKVEMWMLLSPTMLNRSIGPRDKPREAQMEAATRLFGTEDWKRIYAAYDAGIITAAQARHEWTNLMRWRLEHELGYTYTETIPMRMGKGLEIYEMVFASDHHVGKKIMGHLYRLAAGREPVNLAQSKAAKENRKAATAGEFLLFPHVAEDYLDDESVGEWEPIPVHDPAARAWWDAV